MSSLKIIDTLNPGGWAGIASLTVDTYWTHATWYKHDTQSQVSQILRAGGWAGSYASATVATDNYMRIRVGGSYYKSDGTTSTATTDGYLLTVGTWYYVVLRINSTTSARCELIICPEGGTSFTTVGWRNPGGNPAEPTAFSVGDLSEVNNAALGLYAHQRVWWDTTSAGSLSDADLLLEMDSTSVVSTTDNQIAWKMPGYGEASDTTDDSGNGRTLTYPATSPSTKVSSDAENPPIGDGSISISATSSTGIQHWTGPLQLVGIHKTLPILLGQSNIEGFAAQAGFGRQFDISLGQSYAVGFTPSIAKAVTIILGETRAQGFAAQNVAIIRTFLGLLGELRALGFNASSEPIQNANVGLGSAYFTGIAGSVSTVAPASTITASALLRETQAIGLIGQVIRVVFPIVGTAHAEGYGAQALEFIKVISGPDIGEMRAEGAAATAIIGQIRNYTISLGEVGFYALQQALTIQRTLDILVGQTNYTGIEPSLAIFRGGEINLGPQIGVVTLEGLINAAAKIERTGFIGSGLATAEGFGLTAPAGQLSLQSILGEAYASGQIPLVSFNRFFAQLGQAYASGFAPDITYGLWRPIKRRLTTWAAI